MNKKIVALAIIGLFLLAGTTITSAVETEANDNKQEENPNNNEKMTGKDVLIGDVFIDGDGTYDGSIVDANSISNQVIELSSPTIVNFVVNYDASYVGPGTDYVVIRLRVWRWDYDWEIVSDFIKKPIQARERITGDIQVSKLTNSGDRFFFEITATYYFLEEPFLKFDIAAGGGIFNKNRNSGPQPEISFIEKPLIQSFNNLVEKIFYKFPLLTRILADTAVFNRILTK